MYPAAAPVQMNKMYQATVQTNVSRYKQKLINPGTARYKQKMQTLFLLYRGTVSAPSNGNMCSSPNVQLVALYENMVIKECQCQLKN
jgi:hypothetical protein